MRRSNFDRAKVRQLIASRGLKIKWVAEQVGLSVQHFSDALNGRKELGVPAVRLLAHVFGVPEAELLEDTNDDQAV